MSSPTKGIQVLNVGRIFARDTTVRTGVPGTYLLVIVPGKLASLQNEHLHDVEIYDDGGGSLTIGIRKIEMPKRDLSGWRADQILCEGMVTMKSEEE